MFKRVYVEITNVCNLSCSFCHGTRRAPRYMSVQEFSTVLDRLCGHTEYIYYHILGEPLSHSELPRLLKLASERGFRSCITTNGSLIPEKGEALLSAEGLYKLSVSLHSFEANTSKGELRAYLEPILELCEKLSERGTICALRLWNSGGEDRLNTEIRAIISERLGIELPDDAQGSLKLSERLYLENAAKFEWPDENAPEQGVQFCHGLREQLGILCDGTLVPCCLDAEGSIALGNIFEQSLEDILKSPRAVALYKGFSARRPSEALCRKCGYATRFNKG